MGYRGGRVETIHADRRTPVGSPCPYCRKPIETPTEREITSRGRSPSTGKACLLATRQTFCSAQCASYYQMGCEG